MDQLEPQLLARLDEQGEIADTDELAQQLGVVHAALVPTIQSLDSYEMVRAQVWSHLDMQAHDTLDFALRWHGGHIATQRPQEKKHSRLVLAADSRPYLDAGTPEAQVFRVLDDAGTPMSELKVRTFSVRMAAIVCGGSAACQEMLYTQVATTGMSCGPAEPPAAGCCRLGLQAGHAEAVDQNRERVQGPQGPASGE